MPVDTSNLHVEADTIPQCLRLNGHRVYKSPSAGAANSVWFGSNNGHETDDVWNRG